MAGMPRFDQIRLDKRNLFKTSIGINFLSYYCIKPVQLYKAGMPTLINKWNPLLRHHVYNDENTPFSAPFSEDWQRHFAKLGEISVCSQFTDFFKSAYLGKTP